MKYVAEHTTDAVPTHLKDAHYNSAAKLGHGLDYKYAHAYPNHYVKQQYLPDAVVGEKFYYSSHIGHEKDTDKYLDMIYSQADCIQESE